MPDSRAPLSSPRVIWTWTLGLALSSIALYWGALGCGFVDYDDYSVLLAHGQRYDETSLLRSLEHIFLLDFPREEPLILRDVLWAIESRLFGLHNPFGFHLGNVLVNALAVALAFRFLLQATGKLGLSAMTAVLFAVFPIHVEPVCWVLGLKDLLVASFMWLALGLQSTALRCPDPQQARTRELGVLGLLVCALLSKFSAVFLFVVLALLRLFQPHLDGTRAPDAPLEWRRLRAGLPFLVAGVVISGVVYRWYGANLWAYGVLQGRGPGPLSVEHLATLAQYVPVALAAHLGRVFWPFQYSIEYQHPNVNIALSTAELLVGYGVLLGIGAALVLWLRGRKDLAFYGLACAALLLPYQNIQYIGIWAADRYAYGATLFIGAIVVQLGLDLAGRAPALRAPLLAAFIGLIAFYSVRTVAQQRVWTDNLALWRHESSLERPSVLSFQTLAAEYGGRARRAATPAERLRYTKLARAACADGLRLFDRLLLRTSAYRAYEQQAVAKMHVTLAELALLQGQPVTVRLAHLEDAVQYGLTAKSAIMISAAYLERAETLPPPERERWVRQSFHYFVKYAETKRPGPETRGQLAAMAEGIYARRYPFLAGELVQFRARFLQ